jgi:hypothetical protein
MAMIGSVPAGTVRRPSECRSALVASRWRPCSTAVGSRLELAGVRVKPAAMAAIGIARRLVAQFVRLVSISSNDEGPRPALYCAGGR